MPSLHPKPLIKKSFHYGSSPDLLKLIPSNFAMAFEEGCERIALAFTRVTRLFDSFKTRIVQALSKATSCALFPIYI